MTSSVLGDREEDDRAWDSLNGHMLVEDVRLGVMPIGGRSSVAAFSVQPVAGTSVTSDEITETLGQRSHARDLAAGASDWIMDCAVATLTRGKAYYEIAAEGPSSAMFVERMAPHQHRWRRAARIVHARVTCSLPGKYALAMEEMRKALLVISDPLAMGRLMGHFSDRGEAKVPFDFQLFRQVEANALARATAMSGWNGRGAFHPEHGQNEYHFVYRELKFHGFKAMLREQAILCLNECLQAVQERSGKRMGIHVSGLPTEADAAQALLELAAGHTSFNELLARFRF